LRIHSSAFLQPHIRVHFCAWMECLRNHQFLLPCNLISDWEETFEILILEGTISGWLLFVSICLILELLETMLVLLLIIAFFLILILDLLLILLINCSLLSASTSSFDHFLSPEFGFILWGLFGKLTWLLTFRWIVLSCNLLWKLLSWLQSLALDGDWNRLPFFFIIFCQYETGLDFFLDATFFSSFVNLVSIANLSCLSFEVTIALDIFLF